MKKVKFVCDKCLREVGLQILVVGEEMERHLYPVGYQEWCYKCLTEISPDLMMFAQKNKITEGKEIEKYGKI